MSFLYWLAVGIVIAVGIYASVFGNLFPYFLLIALVMAIVGIWQPGIKGAWALLVGFGGLPAALLSVNLLTQFFQSDWSCSRIVFGNSSGSYGYGSVSSTGEVESTMCSSISGQLILLIMVLWAIALSGVLLRSLLRARFQSDGS